MVQAKLTVAPHAGHPTSRTKRRQRLGRPAAHVVLIFVTPGIALYALIVLYPILTAMSYAFFEWNGLTRLSFTGFDNFVTVLTLHPYGDQIQKALFNNGIFFLGTLALQGVGGMLLALAMTRVPAMRRLAQTVISLPYLMSSLVVGYIWTMILSPQWGPVNAALRAIGLSSWAQPWLGEPTLIMPILILINNWQWVGAGMLIFGAAILSVPDELLEAATMDGAGFWKRFAYIQLPHLLSAIEVFVVLVFIGAVNVFDLVYAVGGGSSGGPGGAADVLGTLFYRVAFAQGLNSLGLAGAISILILLVTLSLTMLIRGGFALARRRIE